MGALPFAARSPAAPAVPGAAPGTGAEEVQVTVGSGDVPGVLYPDRRRGEAAGDSPWLTASAARSRLLRPERPYDDTRPLTPPAATVGRTPLD